ncbi:cyclin-dependent kinase inhibitor far1 [Podila verticillata]|nr:cyclin-dependent kinase inhibitor far1 [Podila verticillata]
MEFYENNQVIFLTGGTGFVGKTLVEKILRSLPKVQKAIDKTQLQNRVNEEIFGSRLFETLKAQFATVQDFHNQIASKVVPVQGDITLDNLGLSVEDKAMVQADTTVMINCAAAVNYFHPLREAVNMNCYGPLRAFKIAKGMSCLAAMVHISTSFVNTQFGPVVKEQMYPYPLGDPDRLFGKIEAMSDKELIEYERNVVLKVFPNTYLASKSLAEHLIMSWSRLMDLPVAIVRPSIISPSLSEPVPGWVEGMGGCNAVSVLSALGIVQEWIGFEKLVVDLVPVDLALTIQSPMTTIYVRLSSIGDKPGCPQGALKFRKTFKSPCTLPQTLSDGSIKGFQKNLSSSVEGAMRVYARN